MQKEKISDSIRKLFSDDRYDFIQIAELQVDRGDFVSVESAEDREDELVTLTTRNYVLSFFASAIRSTCKSREPSKARFDALMKDEGVDTVTVYFDRDSMIPVAVIDKRDVVSVERSEHASMSTIVKTRSGERQIKFGFVNAIDATYKKQPETS